MFYFWRFEVTVTNHMRDFFGTQESASDARRLVISNWRSRFQNLICLSLIPDSLGGNARTVMVANIVCTASVVLCLSYVSLSLLFNFLLVRSIHFKWSMVKLLFFFNLRCFPGPCKLQFWRNHHNITVRFRFTFSYKKLLHWQQIGCDWDILITQPPFWKRGWTDYY